MQSVLVLKRKNKKIISFPWCFEAFCIMCDNRSKSPIQSAEEAVRYLFLGTEATDDVVNELSEKQRKELCIKVLKWFIDDMAVVTKKMPAQANGGGTSDLRDVYSLSYKAWGTLPSEIAKQRPCDVFGILLSGDDDKLDEIPEDLKCLYGI